VINAPALGMPELMSGTMVDSVVNDHRVMLDDLAERYRKRVMIGRVMLETGDATPVITDTAQHVGADLIVMGTHGRTGVTRFLLGSIAETVVRKAHCPVLVIHTHAKDEEKAA
jgi:universal stress protein A